MASALSEAVSVPLPASGTDTTSTWSLPNIAVLMGSRMAPWVAATSACRAETAWLTWEPPRSRPVTTTYAGSGPPGKAPEMAIRLRTTGTFDGRS